MDPYAQYSPPRTNLNTNNKQKSAASNQMFTNGFQDGKLPPFPYFPFFHQLLALNPLSLAANHPTFYGNMQAYKNWLVQMGISNKQDTKQSNQQQNKDKIKSTFEKQIQVNDARQDEVQEFDFNFGCTQPFQNYPISQSIFILQQNQKRDQPNKQQTNQEEFMLQIEGKINKLLIKSLIETGYGKDRFSAYLKAIYPKINTQNILRLQSRYTNKLVYNLRKVPNQVVNFLHSKFNMNVEQFQPKHQIKYLAQSIRYYKIHFNDNQQKTIENILKYLVELETIWLSQNKIYDLYLKMRQLLQYAYKSRQQKRINNRQERISNFIKTKENEIKKKVVHKDTHKAQDDFQAKYTKQIISYFQKTELKTEWRKLYKKINPLCVKQTLDNQIAQVLKEVFLKALYKLEKGINKFKLQFVGKYLQHIKKIILYERILTPTFRQLAMILLQVYQEKGEIKEQKAQQYVQKIKTYLKRTGVNRSFSEFERFEKQRNNMNEIKEQTQEQFCQSYQFVS